MKNELAPAMYRALSTTWQFYVKARGFHWNVTGPNFPQLHSFFESLYTETWGAIDTIAENIRTLGLKVPGNPSLLDIGKIQGAGVKETAEQMVRALADDNKRVLEALNDALAWAGGEPGTQNMLQDRIEAHKKHQWMLDSTL